MSRHGRVAIMALPPRTPCPCRMSGPTARTRAGHVRVDQDERVGVDRPGSGQFGEWQGTLVGCKVRRRRDRGSAETWARSKATRRSAPPSEVSRPPAQWSYAYRLPRGRSSQLPSGVPQEESAMVGLGYADTVTRACAAADCHDIKGVDVDAAQTRRDRSGRFRTAALVLAPVRFISR